jgi:iron(III) transport system substrate-binding protein
MMKIFALLTALMFPLSAWGADAEEFISTLAKLSPQARQEKLIEGAKKEGEVMLYSSSGLEEVRAITALFQKKYPFVKIHFMRKGGSQLFNVAVLEHKSGKHIADGYWAGTSSVGPMVKTERSMLSKYISPERSAVGDEYKDKDGYWTATRTSVAIFAYHAKKVPAEKVPKVYNDLLDPYWKGQLSIDTNPDRSPYLLSERIGWKATEEYLKKLAQQDLRLHRGRSARLQLILSGEVLAGLDINADNIVALQKENAPLDYAIMNPSLLSLTALAMPKKVPHPHAAVLLYDFIISKEGQAELAKEDNIPVRSDVEIVAKSLAQRFKEGQAQKKFVVQSPGTFDPAEEDKFDRAYINILVKKNK